MDVVLRPVQQRHGKERGEQLLPLITDEETLFRVTDAAIGFFERNANAGERFRLTLQRLGEDEFRKEIMAAYEGK
mgnify:CR=1 FL=1